MCADLAHLKLQKSQEIIFTKIAKSNVMLPRITQGENGLRIYGGNVMAIISCSKTTQGQRIICFPYPVNDLGVIVYRPTKVLSHDDYVALLKNPALLEKNKQTSLSKMEVYQEDPRQCNFGLNGVQM